MQRRDFLTTAALGAGTLATGTLATPGVSRAQGTRVLRFIPQANLSSLDAIAGTQYVVRNAACWCGTRCSASTHQLDAQAADGEGYENSPDFKDWTFKLRAGLKFHDGEPVSARDVIASLNRWMVRDTMGQRIKASLDELAAPRRPHASASA